MFEKFQETIFTKQQLQKIISEWGVDVQIPRIGRKSVVCWPTSELAEITKIKAEGDFKGYLFKVEFYRPARSNGAIN